MIRAARLAAAIAIAAAAGPGCGNDRAAPRDAGGGETPACAGDPAAFVRQAYLALDGRRPLGQDEVDVYVDLYRAAVAAGDRSQCHWSVSPGQCRARGQRSSTRPAR